MVPNCTWFSALCSDMEMLNLLQVSSLAIHEAGIWLLVSVSCIQWSSLHLREIRPELCEAICQLDLSWEAEESDATAESRREEIGGTLHRSIWTRSFQKDHWKGKERISCFRNNLASRFSTFAVFYLWTWRSLPNSMMQAEKEARSHWVVQVRKGFWFDILVESAGFHSSAMKK